MTQHANVGMVRGISTRELGDNNGGVIKGISFVGFGYGRLSSRLTMFNAACRQTLEEACDENGNWIDGFKDAEVFPGDGMLFMRQHSGVFDAVEAKSQCRLRKMGMSWKAQKRCVFILALVLSVSFSGAFFGECGHTFEVLFLRWHPWPLGPSCQAIPESQRNLASRSSFCITGAGM